MANDISAAIAELHAIYRDVPPARALGFVARAYQDAAILWAIHPRQYFIELGHGVREVVLEEGISVVTGVRFQSDTGAAPVVLEGVEERYLDEEDTDWRDRRPSMPQRYYVASRDDALVLGVEPMSDRVAAGGFPRLIVRALTVPLEIDAEMPLPKHLGPHFLSYLAYTAAAMYAQERDRDGIPLLLTLAEREKQAVNRHVKWRGIEAPTRIYPRVRRSNVT